ncbi:HNH endonuclease [Salegentibacter sp. Hel_I_6]|uniref:HNH endonuclease n=1 Tax=Salegentibacter sp. Hel_I_6 TaxID=1250278 RepID=UPI001E316428|nr:hypothetical protein [Salegentibacter sp. Hel_I_6]
MDFLFEDVWLPAEGDFVAEKLKGNKKLYNFYINNHYLDDDSKDEQKKKIGKTATFFNSSIEKIFKAFAEIDDDDFKLDLIDYYSNNNNIQEICTNPKLKILTYQDLEVEQKILAREIKSFYSKLYGKESPFNLKDFGSLKTKSLPSHYQEFFTHNTEGKCPFCGIKDLKGIHHTKKEAYDHYIPKGKFPFNSINFKNLAPMCNDCNSSYKGEDLVIGEISNRNKAFYPYKTSQPDIKDFQISLKLNNPDILEIQPDDIELEIKLNGFDEEIEAWKRVFEIDERYKALLCNKSEGIAWFNMVVDGYDNAVAQGYTGTKKDFLNMKLFDTNHTPLSGYGFIKNPFLEECESMGLF